jgi:hypothetical protein
MKSKLATIEKALHDSGATKVKISDEGRCHLIVADYPEDVFIISVSPGSLSKSTVIKIVPSTKLATISWSCESLEYSPHGLYIIEENEEALYKKILRKIESLRTSLRSVD